MLMASHDCCTPPLVSSPPLIISDEISDTLGWSDRADDLANGLYLDKRVVKAYSWDDVTERTMLATVFSSHEVYVIPSPRYVFLTTTPLKIMSP